MAVSVVAGYGPPSVEKPLGVLPVARDYLARLDLVGTIDRLAPMRQDVSRVSHGQVIAALVANRLGLATTGDGGVPLLPRAYDGGAGEVGWYALLTNLPDSVVPTGVLARYKGQEVSERRYGTFKGPLAVAPMFLHSNQRIHASSTSISSASTRPGHLDR